MLPMDKKERIIRFRARKREEKTYKQAASLSGDSFSEWARTHLNEAAMREIQGIDKKITSKESS